MARKGMVQIEGVVEKIQGGGFHDVKLDNGIVIRARLSGKLRLHKIKVVVGDRVDLEVSAADPTGPGFIVYRRQS